MKVVVLLLLTFFEVRCECDDVFSCFSDVVYDLFGVQSNETVKISGRVNYTLVDLDSEPEIKKTFQAVADEFKNSIQNKTEIVSESPIFRKSDNNTVILVKTIDLGNDKKNGSITDKKLKTNKQLKIQQSALNNANYSEIPAAKFQEASQINELIFGVDTSKPVYISNETQHAKSNILATEQNDNHITNKIGNPMSKKVSKSETNDLHDLFYITKDNTTTTVKSNQYITASNINVNKTVTNTEDDKKKYTDNVFELETFTTETDYISEDLVVITESSAPLLTELTTESYQEIESNTEQDFKINTTNGKQPEDTVLISTSTHKPQQKENRKIKSPTAGSPIIPSSNQSKRNKTRNLAAQVKSLKSDLEKALDSKRNEISEYTDEYQGYTDIETEDYLNLDYVNYYEDTTNEDVGYTTEALEVTPEMYQKDFENSMSNGNCHSGGANGSVASAIFPPIAAIFIKNGSGNQFEYVCDGAILTTAKILTAARCLTTGNGTRDPDDVIVIVGKRTLADMTGNQALRVQSIMLHVNFTTDVNRTENDLAAITLERDVIINERVQTACVYDNTDKNITDASTTGWQTSGDLLPIRLMNNKDICSKPTSNVFCDSYGYDVSTCPSRGGLYFVKLQTDLWYLKGVLSEDLASRGLCTDRSLRYTDVTQYGDWIKSL